MKNRLHYAYIVAAVCSFSAFVLAGIGFTFGVFIRTMRADLGWSLAVIGYAFGVRQAVSGVFQPVGGSLIRRYGPKKLMWLGLAILGISTVLLFTVNSPWSFYLLYGVASTIGVTMGAMGPMAAIISRWFQKRRAVMLSVQMASSSAGQLVLTPLIFLLLTIYGWRMTYVFMGVFVLLVILPLVVLLLKEDPAEKGLLPDAARPAPGSPPLPKVKGAWQKARAPGSGELNLGLRHALRTRNFWLLCLGYFGCGVSWTFIAVYFIPFAVDEVGVSDAVATMAYSVMGGANVVGIMSAGYLADRIGRKIPLGVVYIGRGVSALMILNAVNEWQVFAAAVVMGVCSFASVPLVQATVADNWGTISMALIAGVILAVHQIGGTLGTIFGGWVMTSYGTVAPGWWMMAATLFVGGVMTFLIREKKRAPKAAVPAPAKA